MRDETRVWQWWELSAPLEIAVMQRMGLHYPTADEILQHVNEHPEVSHNPDWQSFMWPAPDMIIVAEELLRLEARRKTDE